MHERTNWGKRLESYVWHHRLLKYNKGWKFVVRNIIGHLCCGKLLFDSVGYLWETHLYFTILLSVLSSSLRVSNASKELTARGFVKIKRLALMSESDINTGTIKCEAWPVEKVPMCTKCSFVLWSSLYFFSWELPCYPQVSQLCREYDISCVLVGSVKCRRVAMYR